MMQIETRAIDHSGQTVSVAWWTGYSRHGVLNVTLPDISQDFEIAAELVALRHLLFEEQVFDRVPSSSKGYSLKVSKGAIKKLVQGKSSKKHLLPYAAFLRQRMEGVLIDVSRNSEWVKMACDGSSRDITVSIDDLDIHEYLDTPSLGRIYITRHAVKRYEERHPGEEMSNPWRSLTTRLMNPNLVRVEIPRKALLHKAMRHGRADNIEAWGHPDSRFVYLVVADHGRKTLVTVFRKGASQGK